MAQWTATDIPDQTGRTIVVTGANSGLGLIDSRELARAGATVVMACRNTEKGERAAEQIRSDSTNAQLKVEALDLADLASVRAFAERFEGQHEHLDVLINNAGIMAAPRRVTSDGFESQFATNHLGHFALTGLLLAKLLAAPEPRVVTESSGMHAAGRIKFDDLQGERRYFRWLAYGQSKLANLMFAFELQRRATEAGTALKSVAAHPGYSETNLQFAAPPPYERPLLAIGNRLISQTAEMGALPTLYAATVPDLLGASYIGPDGWLELRGYPKVVTAAGKAYNQEEWRRLWEVSEQLTGVHYDFAARAPVA